MRLQTIIGVIIISTLLSGPFSLMSAVVRASTADEIAAKNAQIQEIQRQIDEYQKQIDAAHGQAVTLQSEVKSLNAQINQIALELKSLNLSIGNTTLQINDTQARIIQAQEKITKDQGSLAQYIRILYQNDQETLTSILIKNNTLSDFFNELNSVRTVQDELKVTIRNITDLKTSLEEQKQELEDKKAHHPQGTGP